MKTVVKEILDNYLALYPNEKERQKKLIKFINSEEEYSINDWNNTKGHLTAGAFIYAVHEKKFLVVYHKDFKTFLYPGGHTTSEEKTPLETACKEVQEETGLTNLQLVSTTSNMLIPIDIDTHLIEFNPQINMPEHYHFDFRYLFIIDNICNINLDTNELNDYKWVDIESLYTDKNIGNVIYKVDKILLHSNSFITNYKFNINELL